MPALTDEQRMIVRTARKIAENEFQEDAFTWEGETPWDNISTLAESELLGINFEEKYGGAGLSELEVVLLVETIGRICPDTARLLNGMHMVAPRAIDMFGSEAVKEKYLPGLIEGESYIAIAMSEPQAGSDLKSMNTVIEERGGKLVLNGEKTWVSHVSDSTAAVVWVKFPDGLGTVVLDFDWPGVEIQQHYTNMAGGSQTHFYMEDVVLPEENVLTRGPEAFKQQLQALNWERLSVAAVSNATAACALDKALEYAQQRVQFDQPIADFQGIEWKLADMAKEIQLSRAFVHQIAQQAYHDREPPRRLDSSIANLYSAEMLERVVSEALQIHGANGYQQGHPLEYLYRFQRGFRLAGGTDEIQKNQIATRLKRDGLPILD